jgi:hypothetical protein
MIHLLLLAAMMLPQDCQYDERCGAGMCLVWEHTRMVCEPKQYTVAVWDRICLEKAEFTENSKMEAPMVDGKPDMEHVTLKGTKVTFKSNCWRYEVRNH